jgi:hypothetical protein
MDALTLFDTDQLVLLECLHLVLDYVPNSSKLVFPLEGCKNILYGESRVLRSRAETLVLTTHGATTYSIF